MVKKKDDIEKVESEKIEEKNPSEEAQDDVSRRGFFKKVYSTAVVGLIFGVFASDGPPGCEDYDDYSDYSDYYNYYNYYDNYYGNYYYNYSYYYNYYSNYYNYSA